MKILAVLIIFLSSFLTVGCAGHHDIPMVDVTATPPNIIQKIPLNVAILISDELENYTFTAKDNGYGGTHTFHLGQMIKKNVLDMLSPAFNKVVLVKGKLYYPQGIDAIVVPTVEKFQSLYEGGFSINAYAKISIKLAVYDMNGMPVWEGVISSPRVTGGKMSVPSHEVASKALGVVAAESVVAVLKEAAKVISSSHEIHTFVSTKGIPEIVASRPVEKELPTVKSDVDELPAIKVKQNKNAYAIVIGIENYRQKLPKADYAVADAKVISEYLTKTMGYPEENVITLLNDRALKSDMDKYFDRWLSNNVEENGRVFIYYSGHGAPNTKTGDAYLVPYDGDPTFIAETGYSIARLYESLGKLKAKEITVVLDSCFSGAGGRSVLAKGAKPLVMTINMPTIRKNISVMTASSGDQISSAYDEKGHGLFTYFLLKGIKGEDVVRQDGSIKMEDLFGYIKPQVERIARKQFNNEQTPQLIGAK